MFPHSVALHAGDDLQGTVDNRSSQYPIFSIIDIGIITYCHYFTPYNTIKHGKGHRLIVIKNNKKQGFS